MFFHQKIQSFALVLLQIHLLKIKKYSYKYSVKIK